MTSPTPPLHDPPAHERVAAALVDVAATLRWPDGSLVLELTDTVLRDVVAPELAAALMPEAVTGPAALPGDHAASATRPDSTSEVPSC